MLGIDVVGSDGTKIVIVELKKSLSRSVLIQASRCKVYTPYCYAAVGTNPKKESLAIAAKYELGVICVKDGKTEVLAHPQVEKIKNRIAKYSQGNPSPWAHKILKRLATHPTDGVAGKPCGEGKAPARECAERCVKFFEDNPGTTWKDAFKNVPNHYQSHSALRSCMQARGVSNYIAPILVS